jgi:hypothetical protein
MPKYEYKCPECGARQFRTLRFCQYKETQYCFLCAAELNKVFTSRFQIIAEREIDKPENQLYRIATNNGGAKDQLEAFKEDQKYVEAENAEIQRRMKKPEEFSTDSILQSGLLEACKSAEGLEAWRRDNIKDEPLPDTDPITEAVEAIA